MKNRIPALAGCLLLLAVAPLLADGKPVVVVDLSGPDVTDAVLKELAPPEGAGVAGPRLHGVTDKGLKELAELKGLQLLFLNGCKGVTDAGVAELQKALPDCNIQRYP
jgi:hypothetical protein